MKKLFFVAAVALCATMVSCGSSDKAAQETAEPAVEEVAVEEVAVAVDSVVADSAAAVVDSAAVVAELFRLRLLKKSRGYFSLGDFHLRV